MHDTPHQRQNKIYAPDLIIKIDVEDVGLRLQTTFVDNRHLVVFHGEQKQMDICFHNTGNRPIGELWMLTGPDDEVWLSLTQSDNSCK